MTKDRKIVYTVAIVSFVLLLTLSLIPYDGSRLIAAILLVPTTAVALIFIKKRSIFSYNKRQVFFLLTVMGVVSVMLYFLTIVSFGFGRRSQSFTFERIGLILQMATIIVATELIRSVFLAQESKFASVFAYLICVLGEVLLVSGFGSIERFNQFMDVVGLSLFPALISNLTYHYLSKRYGAKPNIAYRLITTLYAPIIPVVSLIPDSLMAFAKLILPLFIYWFIDLLYERKPLYATKRKSKWGYVGWGAFALILTGIVAITSNQFGGGMLVVGSESMTGEYNKGDAVFYEDYDGEPIKVGDVLVFMKGTSRLIHRVVEIEHVNGQTRYYTKGDANESKDSGYITAESIIGVANVKIPYFGYLTIWLKELF